MAVGVPPVEHLVTSAAILGAAVLAAWPALFPTMAAPASDPLFVVPRGHLAVLGAIALAAFMAEGAMGDWSAIYIRMDLGASPATAAWGFAAFSLTMAIGRLTGDWLVARVSSAGMIVGGALIGAATLAGALIAGHPAAAVLGFAGMGLGLANVAPIVFSAAGRMSDLAPGIGIAAVSTAGYCGLLAGPPLIGLVAELSGLSVGLGLVAGAVGLMVLGAGAVSRRPARAVAPPVRGRMLTVIEPDDASALRSGLRALKP
jgi:MFS family permease